MATSDGESCSAEDRAVEAFACTPYDHAGDSAQLWPIKQRAFRQGFRAGQEQSGRAVAEMRVVATADSPLGDRLNALEERLNALEEAHGSNWSVLNGRVAVPELMHEGQPEKTTQWERGTELRLDRLESGHGSTAHCQALDNHQEQLNEMRQSIEKLESKVRLQEATLRLLEPIG